MYDNFKTNNVIFPLSCLLFNNDYEKLFCYCIYKYSLFLKKNNRNDKYDSEMVIELADDINIFIYEKNIKDFDPDDPQHSFIILACIKMDIDLYSINEIIQGFSEINEKIYLYEKRHGKDTLVKIHKDMLFDVLRGNITNRLFNVYCAIKGIVGNSAIKWITINRIKHAACGFKSVDVYKNEIKNSSNKSQNPCNNNIVIPPLLTDRQIKTTIDNLKKKNLIDYYTNKNRYTYYATKPGIRDDLFLKKLAVILAHIKLKQEEKQIRNVIMQNFVDNEYEKELTRLVDNKC